MSNVAKFRARLLAVAAALLVTIGAAPAAAAPWDANGGVVNVRPIGATSPLVLSESFKAALTKSKVVVTARSGAVTTGPGTFSLPVSRIEWYVTDRTLFLQGAAHRGVLEFRGPNGLRIGLGNLRPQAGGGFADLLINGSRVVSGLPLLSCALPIGDDYEAYVAALGDQNAGIECPLRLSSLASSLLDGLTGTRAFGRGTVAYMAVVREVYNQGYEPTPPNTGTN